MNRFAWKSRKQKFYIAKSLSVPEDKLIAELEKIGQCPTGCGKCEGQLHFLCCTNKEKMILRKEIDKVTTAIEVRYHHDRNYKRTQRR